MNVSIQHIINLLNSSNTEWLRVNEEICLHRYFDRYYILLCHWFDPELKSNVIYLEVDDLEAKKEDVLLGTYPVESKEYNLLYPIYESAKPNAKVARRNNAS